MNIVEMRDIYKAFGEVIANNHVNFELDAGEIHALLGENGAGKTTLMRILYGLYHEDSGKIFINGKEEKINSPKQAIKMGIGMVTQHFTLVPTLTVTENINLGYINSFSLHYTKMENDVKKASEKYGIHVNPNTIVGHLSVGERQRVEILKALYKNAKILILDEPTAVLVPQEVDMLFESLEKLRKTGLSVIFISHKLKEVTRICDRVTVLRDGKTIGTVNVKDTNKSKLARMMVGRETFGVSKRSNISNGKIMLQVENLCVEGNQGLPALKNVSFEIKSGEILGLAGVSGNGQSELSRVLSGILKPDSGYIYVHGERIKNITPTIIMHSGISRIPEDRHKGIIGELSVSENLIIEHMEDFTNHGQLDRNNIDLYTNKLINDFQIKASPKDKARTLSGGNIQKLILSRTLSRNPLVVLAAQPTRGLDIGATEYVRTMLLEQRKRGAAVLLISEDLDEILALSDRIAVIYEGEIMGIVSSDQASVEKIGLMMSGSSLEFAS